MNWKVLWKVQKSMKPNKTLTGSPHPKVLDHVPVLLYILAAKTLLLCLAFAGVKVYQRRRLEAKLQRLEAEKKLQAEKKDN